MSAVSDDRSRAKQSGQDGSSVRLEGQVEVFQRSRKKDGLYKGIKEGKIPSHCRDK